MVDNIKQKILNGIFSAADFEALALEICAFQYKYNAIYKRYCSLIGKDISKIHTAADIPFLPISFFKTHTVKTGHWLAETVFTSSGTTGQHTSRHEVHTVDWYSKISLRGFEQFYGAIGRFCVLGLLPSYLERTGSSLIQMVSDFIALSEHLDSGFFLHNFEDLHRILLKNQMEQTPTLLIGVSFALLDFVEKYNLTFPELIVMETGGMKGRRREMIRQELHTALQAGFGVANIHSEYGMTELLSQAYSNGQGLFRPTFTFRPFVRDVNDPLSILTEKGRLGVLNIIDLANVDTCSFIATDDFGRIYPDGTFEVLGRMDNSDIRGCNLLVEQSE